MIEIIIIALGLIIGIYVTNLVVRDFFAQVDMLVRAQTRLGVQLVDNEKINRAIYIIACITMALTMLWVNFVFFGPIYG